MILINEKNDKPNKKSWPKNHINHKNHSSDTAQPFHNILWWVSLRSTHPTLATLADKSGYVLTYPFLKVILVVIRGFILVIRCIL
ncbi:hypothetical protein THIOM_001202 [Candidatus Thiomargarita nelsonii]|uniref:Uncharacterized protein n=1 Tax=Candidatus Thiomargarita nelsonii TaxID=1003181 RepID=A0A176S4Y1_9GAMM|nr:hypothetical protein THIOM_001202 [Candidatus Thiomargarita nelsonii]